jgi:lipopolysaccharide/colanic/teichoic acid biosynthesis glycosyltransferase
VADRAAGIVAAKRFVDASISLVGLIVFSPVMGLIAVLIKATSKGSVVYSQRRVGRFGRGFLMHKFRSMVQEADSIGSSVTVDRDPRITPVGRFLRRSKLDELPQLWNVLRGEMSLVGPRPEVPEIVEEYTPAMRRILDVAPGMTSVASLELRAEEALLAGGPEAELAYRRILVPYKVELGMQHVVRRSTVYDLWVLVRTVWALTAGRLWSGGDSAVIAEARRRLEAFNHSTPTRIDTTGDRQGGTTQRPREWPGVAGASAPGTRHRDSAS